MVRIGLGGSEASGEEFVGAALNRLSGGARAVNARYRGVCRGCGAYTQPRNGKGDA